MSGQEIERGEHFAEEIMETDVLTAEKGTSVKKAVELMAKKGFGCLVVLENETAVGMVTERDILNKITAEGVDPARIMIQDIMTAPLISVHRKATIAEVAEKMSTFQVRRTVVVDQKGEMAGLVTSEDLAKWLARLNKYADQTLNAVAGIKRGASSGPYG
jgi:CBS domain-containing protein